MTLIYQWKKYLASLIPTTNFTMDELKIVLNKVNPSKAFGPDNIPAIVWKDEHFYEILLKLCNFCAFEHSVAPALGGNRVSYLYRRKEICL